MYVCSALNYDSTTIDVILLNRKSDGLPVTFRNGIDKNFQVGLDLIHFLDCPLYASFQ